MYESVPGKLFFFADKRSAAWHSRGCFEYQTSYSTYSAASAASPPLDLHNSHACDKCPKSFRHAADLRRHYKLHFQLKQFPYLVPGCARGGDNGYSRKDKLNDHRRTAHGLAAIGADVGVVGFERF